MLTDKTDRPNGVDSRGVKGYLFRKADDYSKGRHCKGVVRCQRVPLMYAFSFVRL